MTELGMDDDVAARLINLESRLAHHERMAEELSDVIAEQGATIARLTAQLHRLMDRLGDMEAGWGPSPQDSKPPPHY